MFKKLENILVVVNPVSGNKNKEPVVQKLSALVKDEINLTFYKTSGEKDKQEIQKLVKQHRPERILVAGGDGTIKLVAEAVENETICIGILPLGSANGLANDLDLPFRQEDYLSVALGETTRKIDAILLNDQLGFHISDLGLNAELIKKYEESNFRGKFGYFLNSIPTLYDTEIPYDFTIDANGKKETYQGVMLAFANSRKYGTGAIVNPKGEMDDGKFEILLFKKIDIFEIIKSLQRENAFSEDSIKTIVTTEATITTNHPVGFQIDGEYQKAVKKVKAKIAPSKLEIATKS